MYFYLVRRRLILQLGSLWRVMQSLKQSNALKICLTCLQQQDDVVKVNVFLTNMEDFAAMNSVYMTMFNKPYPARTTIGVLALPLGANVEIEMIAKKR